MVERWAVEAAALTKSYGDVRVLDGVDLRVAAGTLVALLGSNGAGKTTTVRILTTLVAADGGSARVGGYDVVSQRHEVRRTISLTGQYAAVDEPLTGVENLVMVGRLCGLSRRAAHNRADELLERFDLTAAADRRVGTYSGGMRRRLDIAAGLVGRPSVIFLDEPTTGLDPRSRQSLWEVVAELVRSGVSALLTTQYLEEANQLADRVAVLDGGRVVAEGTAAELKHQVAGERLDLVATSRERFDLLVTRLGARALHADPHELVLGVPTDGSAAHVRSLLDELDPDGRSVARFSVHTATLDDVFLALTGTAVRATEEPAHA
ncbi:ATP-binding cassette domain-containing protein [Actinokineospora bangkokensis]|uniref:ABC transporter n=1 Tax=Actinokineospora bangkokensis TaxID=1193682 RepID=A0A1Q9LJK0_9PSEU|nr:ATP-binding cassette domain-containing protein [Actinokineospora bangkokensis]OLR92216.1 ABC transporter [Actinokineospora bangkokensis]